MYSYLTSATSQIQQDIGESGQRKLLIPNQTLMKQKSSIPKSSYMSQAQIEKEEKENEIEQEKEKQKKQEFEKEQRKMLEMMLKKDKEKKDKEMELKSSSQKDQQLTSDDNSSTIKKRKLNDGSAINIENEKLNEKDTNIKSDWDKRTEVKPNKKQNKRNRSLSQSSSKDSSGSSSSSRGRRRSKSRYSSSSSSSRSEDQQKPQKRTRRQRGQEEYHQREKEKERAHQKRNKNHSQHEDGKMIKDSDQNEQETKNDQENNTTKNINNLDYIKYLDSVNKTKPDSRSKKGNKLSNQHNSRDGQQIRGRKMEKDESGERGNKYSPNYSNKSYEKNYYNKHENEQQSRDRNNFDEMDEKSEKGKSFSFNPEINDDELQASRALSSKRSNNRNRIDNSIQTSSRNPFHSNITSQSSSSNNLSSSSPQQYSFNASTFHHSGNILQNKYSRIQRYQTNVSPSPAQTPNEQNEDQQAPVIGTCQDLEKPYFRLTSAPDPSSVRPRPVLERSLEYIKTKWMQDRTCSYEYICEQMKSIRQDLTVQHIKDAFTVSVYESHARIALRMGDLAEYNQCQSILMALYKEGIKGNVFEFTAYQMLHWVYLHDNAAFGNFLRQLSPRARMHQLIQVCIQSFSAMDSGNWFILAKLKQQYENALIYREDNQQGGKIKENKEKKIVASGN
ncbi:MAG: putative SAC3/GANP domain protein, partial [Streblomastix strix]